MAVFNFRRNSISKKSSTENASEKPETIPEESTSTEAQVHSEETQAVQELSEPKPESLKSQTVAHITSYPLIRESLDVVEAIPGVRVVKLKTESLADPIVGFLFHNGFIQPIFKAVDDFGNQTLGTIDNFVPSIKTTGYIEVGEMAKAPFVYADDTIRAVVVATNDAIDVNILEPTKKLVHDTRAYYNKNIYDTKGKPLLRSSVDPVFRPINQAVDEFISTHLPREGEAISQEFSSEIERNLWLTWDLKKRSIPVIAGKINEAICSPFTYSKHVLDVYNDNLNKQEQKSVSSSIVATYNSSLDLVEEAWSKVTDSTWNKVFKKGKVEQSTVISNAEPIEPITTVEVVNGTTQS